MVDRDELYGRTIGEFVLRERIGEGGFGAVYRCEQPALGREAVIKVLHQRLRGNDVVRQRFLREAQLASRLDHPYAAHVYAFGVERLDGLFWIAMEMVHGTTLDRWLELRGALRLDQLVPFFERVAEVVHTAHECGIVHRDLKASNIMVIERAGRLLPKLLDFGIAKLLDDTPVTPAAVPETVADGHTLTSSGDSAGSTLPDRPRAGFAAGAGHGGTVPARGMRPPALTHTNATLGSPPYMSPEQWRDPLRVGPRSDLYALGIIAYEALTGRRPFVAPTAAAFSELHCHGDVPPVGPEFPPALDALFRRALAKQIDDRPASALELAEALRVASGLANTPPGLDRAQRRRPWLALVAGAALIGGAAVALIVVLGGDGAASREPPAPPAPPAPPVAQLRLDPAPASAPAPAPATVAIHIESAPPRADVFRLPSEVKVGVTPWDGELARADGVAVFVVKKRGYADRQIEVDLRTGARSRVILTQVPTTAHPPEGRRKGEPADPFQDRAR